MQDGSVQAFRERTFGGRVSRRGASAPWLGVEAAPADTARRGVAARESAARRADTPRAYAPLPARRPVSSERAALGRLLAGVHRPAPAGEAVPARAPACPPSRTPPDRPCRARGFAVLGGLAALVALLIAATQPALSGPGTVGAPVPAPVVTSIGLTVSDLDHSVAFFRDVLDFELLGTEERAGLAHERLEGVFALRSRVATLRLGRETLTLTQHLTPAGRPVPEDSRSNDEWFQHVALVVADMEAAYARLRAHGVRHASPGPQRLPDWNPAAGGIEAFYFKDPDGHALELIHFPPGKGDPRWQHATTREATRASTGVATAPSTNGSRGVSGDGAADVAAGVPRLFLGIDHTAIVVHDTEASLRFWRDGLGLAVVGGSENWGPEQERLNGVFGARLRITALRGAGGPGVEFLEYLAPSDGRPAPVDARGTDLTHWETLLQVADLGDASDRTSLAVRLREGGGEWISPGPVALDDGAGRALLLRDPSGHAVELHAAAAP